MKQHTNESQTAKLIALGFEKPKSIVDKYYDFDTEDYKEVNHYSIGELIGILPDKIFVDGNTYSKVIDKTDVCYYSWVFEIYAISICDVQEELIDNLYDMCIKLKEEGVI